MTFQLGGIDVTLQGDPSLSKALVSLKAMMKAFKKNGERVLLEIGKVIAELNELQVGLPRGLEKVLAEFEGVFPNPEGLPPTRNKDHAINLLPNTSSISV